MDVFDKTSKISHAIEDTYFSQLDFPINHVMFTHAQIKTDENYNDT